ncbi:MAG: hypothetical protein LBV76_05005 [Deltaproteobacteria bacterium]|jgi:hypothetical protein|nr:hypothetical protein [Deltaproteobacteria bacterium]
MKTSANMISSVLKRTFDTLKQNPSVYLTLAVAAAVPTIVLQMILTPSAEMSIVISIIHTVLSTLIQGATAYAVYKSLMGDVTNINAAIGYALKLIAPLCITSLLVGIGISLGLTLFVVPGLLLMCLWSMAIPVCAVERLTPIGCLKRSVELTKGYRWYIFALMIIVGLGLMIISLIIGAIFGSANSLLATVLVSIAGVVFGSFHSVMVPTIYYGLLVNKESVTLDSLANVFD